MRSDWKGIRYEWGSNYLTVPLYGVERLPCEWVDVPRVIAELVMTRRPKLELLEKRMGDAHHEIIKRLVGSNGRLLEYGAGASTLWYRANGIDVVTVEHDPIWATIIGGCMLYPMPGINPKCEDIERLPVMPVLPPYVKCERLGDFDVILIDGVLRNACLSHAGWLLRSKGGVVVLHDAQRDWYDAERAKWVTQTYVEQCLDYKIPTLWIGAES